MSSPQTFDADAIRDLVTEVLRRIASGQAGVSPSAAGHAGPGGGAGATPGAALPDRVITLASVERLARGARTIAIGAKAVVTPSAADRARELGLTLVRGAVDAVALHAAHPFVIAQAACRGDASARASAIARAIPAAQQLPASGLAEVITALAGHASRDAARGILLTGRPAVAAVLANRSASLRAVTGRDAASLAAAAADAAANLLIVDPAGWPGGGLERLCSDFHRASMTVIPAELQAAPPGCGCKTHSH